MTLNAYILFMEILWLTIPYIPSFWGFFIAAAVVLILGFVAAEKKNGFSVLFGQMYEGMYDFFADILWENELGWIKSFITNMFFVVLLYNLLWLVFDFVSPIFGYDELLGQFTLSKTLGFATSDKHFNIAMAIVWVLLTLWVQFVSMDWNGFLWKKISEKKWNNPIFKFFNFIYEYVPFRGKGIITIEKGTMSPFVFYSAWVVIKLFDIVISLFVGFLDIIGVLAKVISLAFRLFGNMLSGTVLLTILITWMGAATAKLTWWLELPLLAPIILVAQWLLVACIQAFVFPLLIAIFIKVARMGDGEETATA